MKKYLLCTLLVLIFVAGCHTSTENKQEQTDGSMDSVEKKTGKAPEETPNLSDAIQIIDQEYEVYKSGKEIENDKDRTIYFSNESIICYSEEDKQINGNKIFFLYNRETKKKHRIITIKNVDSCWGNMCEKDECLYLAIGVIENKKETSYLLKIDEKTFRGELIKIKACNTIFSSVVCSDHTLFVWFMKEQGDSREYHLGYLEKEKINPINSWIYHESENETGQQMSTLATDGNELFCYVEDKQENAHIGVYNGKGEITKNIPIDFSDFQNTSEGKDAFWKMYCFKNTFLFETVNHRILVAKYDGERMVRIKDEFFLDSLAGDQNSEESGSCVGITSFQNKMILCGNLENRNELLIWETDQEKITNIMFKVEDAEILSYQMLTENEVILRLVDDNAESREFYCKLE